MKNNNAEESYIESLPYGLYKIKNNHLIFIDNCASESNARTRAHDKASESEMGDGNYVIIYRVTGAPVAFGKTSRIQWEIPARV